MPSAADPTASVLRSSYRACLKELQRAYQLHLGNTSHIVKAVFGPLMDVETLRRAGLLGTLHTPLHAYDATLRPTNIVYTYPHAQILPEGTEKQSWDDKDVPNFSKERRHLSIIGCKATSPQQQKGAKGGKGKKTPSHQTVVEEPKSEMSDGVALAHLLRLFYELPNAKGTTSMNPYYAAIAHVGGDNGDQQGTINPAKQMEALAKSFELLKRLRESTAGYVQPRYPSSSKETKGDAKKDTKGTTNTEIQSKLPFIELTQQLEAESEAFIHKCVQIVSGASRTSAASNETITGDEDERAIYTRICLPQSGTGAIRAMHNMFVPSDPFHANNINDNAPVSFASELAFIEALAASNNVTKNEIFGLVSTTDTATDKHENESLYALPSSHIAKVVEDPNSGVIRWNPPQGTLQDGTAEKSRTDGSRGTYSALAAYSRSTVGHLISPLAQELSSAERIYLAPTVVKAGQKIKTLKDDKTEDVTEPRTPLDILNSEFAGVRAPYTSAQKSFIDSEAKFPLISQPRPIETPAGASLVPFNRLQHLPRDSVWYQLATPALFANDNVPKATEQIQALDHRSALNQLPEALKKLGSARSGQKNIINKKVDSVEKKNESNAKDFVSRIPTTTTTVVNGVLSVSVTTTYVGVNGNSFSRTDDEDSTEPKERHVFQYRVTLRNISGGNEQGSVNESTDATPSLEEVRTIPGPLNAAAVGVDLIVISRHWAFVDASNGTAVEVIGPGLVGNSPRLGPGQEFTYESGTTMNSIDGGYMRGTLQCIATTKDHNASLVMVLEARRTLSTNVAKRAMGVDVEGEEEDEAKKFEKLLEDTYKHTQSQFDAPISATALRKSS